MSCKKKRKVKNNNLEKPVYKITLKNVCKHIILVSKHRFKVFSLCVKAGEPWRGFVHDLSKFTPTEFFESVRYYSGNRSPISNCKMVNGYSQAWLHHKGRNKHHYEYWYDYVAPVKAPVMPYKYFVEMVCDNMSAGMTYQGKKWTKEYQLSYWMKTKDKAKMNPKMKRLLTRVYTDISVYGVDPVINKKNLKKLYKEYIG